MPFKRENYPADWNAISKRIRVDRAGGKCEQCGAPNGKEIVRSTVDASRYMVFDMVNAVYTTPGGDWIRMSEIPEEYDTEKYTLVVLTVHHKGVDYPDGTPGNMHDKMDCRGENLIALCQRCHLLADLPSHIANAKATRQRKKREAVEAVGQLELFGEQIS